MAQKNSIVKRLLAVETLGSVDTICSDKTGTLTQNEMTVTKLYCNSKVYEVTGTGYAPTGEISSGGLLQEQDDCLDRLMQICAVCNEAKLDENGGQWSIIGDPTEGALLSLSQKYRNILGNLADSVERLGDLPFDSSRKMMSVFIKEDDSSLSLTKGAPDIIIDKCKYELTSKGVVELSRERKEEILANNKAFAQMALRVLAMAYSIHEDLNFEHAEENLVFVGLAGMIDPARPEAKDAILVCHQAGVRAVMITGDYKDTAVAIAKNLGLMKEGDGVLTGDEIEELDDQGLREVCDDISVFARVSPEHKVRIVSALRANGHIVSMTGDGVNDAPALKQADIGVAMGITGTEVAKNSSDMILTDDNFASIVTAVKEGRIIYSNIRKFVGFLLSCNVGEILAIFLTNLMLGPQYAPLLPIQLLWLNLVTDSFPALALGREKGEKNIMLLPPRKRDEKIINREMLSSIIVQSIAIFIAVFAAFQIGRYLYPDVAVGGTALAPQFEFFALNNFEPSAGARTFAFVTLIMAELLRAFSSRSEHYSVFTLGVFSNKTMNKAILLSLALMLVVVYVPALDSLFHTIAPTALDWLLMVPLALIPFICGEVFKLVYHRKTRDKLDQIS